MEYYIFVTNNCNLDCRYCSGVGIHKNIIQSDKPAYSLDMLKEFILKTQTKYNSKLVEIVFYGGEPTLNYTYLLELVDYIGFELGENEVKYVLHTNGMLLNKIPRNLFKKISLVIISINYEKIPHDNLSNTYFSKIIDNVKYVREISNASILGRLTITENVSLYTNILLMSSYFDYIHWQIENNLAFANAEKYLSNYKYELNLSLDYWYSYFKNGILINIIPFVSVVKSLLGKFESDNILCGFNTSSIYIQTNGECYSCPEEVGNSNFKIGSIYKEIQFSPINFKDTICNNCTYFSNCYGRCGRMHIVFDEEHINDYCNINKEMFNFFINNKQDIINIINNYPNYLKKINDYNFTFTEYIP